MSRRASAGRPGSAHDDTRETVLVTGSGGAIGARLVRALQRRWRVIGLDRERDEGVPEWVSIDLADDAAVEAALAEVRRRTGGRIASVVHLAAYYDLSGEDHPLYQTVNVDGTRRLLHALRGFELGQFVYASTMLVHAPTEPGVPIDEDSPLLARWAYPRSKIAAEQVVREDSGDTPYVLLRIAGLYDDDCGSPFLAHQIRRIYERRLTGSTYAGDTARGQAFVHVDDLIDLIVRLVERRAELPRALPLLAGEPAVVSYQALQNQLAHELHGDAGWRTVELPRPLAKAGAWLQAKTEPLVPDAIDRGEQPFIRPYMAELSEDHYELDIGRARKLLGWSPRHRLREAVPRMVHALREDPLGWYARHGLAPPAWMTSLAERDADPAAVYAEHDRQRRQHHRRTQWAHFANAGLGAWLMATPATVAAPSPALAASEITAGAALMVFALLSLSWRMGWARLASACVGLWVMTAPLLFWAPDAASYLNDTLVGALVVCFAIVFPPMPGVSPAAQVTGPDVPPGWDYSPSEFSQRLPIVALACVGLFVSRYLAAFQLGHTGAAWDPFFDDGTERVITSAVSQAWPVPDAGLGALTYALEIVTGLIGGRNRWRTMPWLVLLFGVMIVPLGAISIYFIVIQPIVIGTWCSLCLLAAAAMLVQIPYSFDELLATWQFLRERRRQGRPLLRVFLNGDTCEGEAPTRRPEFAAPLGAVLREMVGGGVGLCPTLMASAAVGVALMCTRLLFDTHGAQADSDHLLGALVVAVSISALAECARPLRLVNVVLGAALMGAPWIFDGGSLAADLAGVGAGALLIALALPRGAVRHRYGIWNRWIV